MSSMGWAARFLPITLLCWAPASAQAPTGQFAGHNEANLAAPSAAAPTAAVPAAVAVAAATDDINSSIAAWRRLRQSGNFSFTDYASLLIYNPDWPGEKKMRAAAEKAMHPGETPATVIAFFANKKPESGNGWARYTEALSASGRTADAVAAAKEAFASPDLSSTDEAYLLSRFTSNLTTADYDRRVDALLFAKDPTDAARIVPWTSAARRASFAARAAMLSHDSNAEALFRPVAGRTSQDAGLLMDRLRYLHDANNDYAARLLAAQPHQFTDRPADVERWFDMLLLLGGGAAGDHEWTVAYNIARQLDDAFAPGADLTAQSYGVRDNYTSLAWLAGRVALDRLNRPSGALAMFARYARGGKSLQVVTKGEYWAGRAALAAGNAAQADTYLQAAANYPELFYGQLALERLGRSVPPPAPTPVLAPTDPERAAFLNNRLVRATRSMFYYGRADEQTQFVQALATSLSNQKDRYLAAEMGRQLRRPELGVWVGRMARNNGDLFYFRDAYPTLASNAPVRAPWSLTHGITRQESSFDPSAISYAGARGMMQLMPGTASDWARKLGVGYDGNKLYTSDYNVMIGSAYFQHLLDVWNGSVPLAVASYNAGSGNVSKWIRAYGDPRTNQVDMIGWIEAIPFTETRGYVQRVIENTVVYDRLNPQPQTQTALHVSRYLGKSSPG
jgi:soluble lytic murein transglycosylase